MISLRVNGKRHLLDVDPETPLLWVLTEHMGLTGTKFSCGIEECGACTVLIDDRAVLSCATPVAAVQGRKIVTIEGLQGPLAKALRKAWLEEDVAQCGYCQPGQIMTAAALLYRNPDPDNEAIDEAMSGVLCRCGTYQGIRKAIHLAAKEYRHAEP
jgi:aerobic-type carbon monoxide dehydrogenase small subunit (CoxS/CutS family)